jgi:hypothetical protein
MMVRKPTGTLFLFVNNRNIIVPRPAFRATRGVPVSYIKHLLSIIINSRMKSLCFVTLCAAVTY